MRTWLHISMACGLALSGFAERAHTRDYLKRNDNWFGSREAEGIAENVLSWQADPGGWPKNVDVTAKPHEGSEADLHPTFDNGATTDELRFLARMYDATRDTIYKEAFKRGFDYIIEAQYSSGGWPQYYPPGEHYHRYITFNDGAMVRLMEFLRETYENKNDYYDFIDQRREQKARKAFKDGVQCILKCQIMVNGKLTAWCAQHDEHNYDPRPARAFELESISGQESVGIVQLLMSISDPDGKIIQAVDAAVAWFREVQISGIRVEVRNGDKVVVKDKDAPPLWARFYEIDTNRPIYCGRDGVKRYELSEIDAERRNGYRWLGDWPQHILETEYPAWKKRVE